MKSALIIVLILTIISTTKFSVAHTPDVVVLWSKSLDKEKRELVKKLKIKTEIEIKRNIYKSDSTKNSIVIYENDYDENGNQTYYKVYGDTLMSKPRYEQEYVTDEMGNVLEAYRQGKLIGTQEFDDEGRIIELVNYDEDGDSEYSYEYEYDSEGNLISELQYLYEELIDTNEYNAYEYILIGEQKLLKSKISLLDKSKIFLEAKELFEYDSLGRIISHKEIYSDDKIYSDRYYDYSLLIGWGRIFNRDGTMYSQDSLKLNNLGQRIERKIYDPGDRLESISFYKYRQDGQLLSEETFSANHKRLFEWQYDKLGHEIEFKGYANEVVNYTRTSTYLDNGLPSKTITVDTKKGEVETREFRYEYY